MVIIGAGGFAKEVLEIFQQGGNVGDIAFYDDVNVNAGDYLYGRFPILKNESQLKEYFKSTDNRFTIGIGNPVLRFKLCQKFTNLGGAFTSAISPKAQIGSYDVEIGAGSNILGGAIISNSTVIGRGCIIYYNSIVTHDCLIGDFVEISPGATVLGRSKLGSFIQLGANSTILPGIIIGSNVVIGAGAVVTKDVPDNCLVAGVPGVIKKELPRHDID